MSSVSTDKYYLGCESQVLETFPVLLNAFQLDRLILPLLPLQILDIHRVIFPQTPSTALPPLLGTDTGTKGTLLLVFLLTLLPGFPPQLFPPVLQLLILSHK